jgi:hypothetical protein
VSRLSSWVCVAAGVLLLPCGPVLAAVPPSENLLPNSTKGYVSAASFDQLRDNWNKTQLGQLMQDPSMKPFVEDFQRQMQEKWLKTHQKLGIKWEDLDGVSSGEVSMAVILASPTESVTAVLADVTGNPQQTSALLDKIKANLIAQKAVRRDRTVHGTVVTVFDIPKHEDEPARQMAYFVKNDLLAMADSAKVIDGILARYTEVSSDSLSNLPAFEAIMKRCRAGAGDLAPHARWFLEPFGYADASRLSSDQPRKKGTDMLKIMREQGFTAVQGMGGYVNFAVDQYEILHRAYVFAPGNKGGGERFTLAARMMEFPNGGTFAPPNWVPRDVASYMAGNLNTKNAFENSKTLINDIVGDEVFEDVLESIRTDENGPKIDVRKEIIAFLGNRVTIISDLQLPITPKSERMLVAVEATDSKKLHDAVKRWMESDPDTKRREINGHEVWEVVDTEAELPMVTIENSPTFGNASSADEPEDPEEKALLPNSAVTVAHGQLFVATHIDILTKVLANLEEREMLVNSPDYKRVQEQLGKLALSEQFGQTFTRTDDAYRGTYELLRAGKMPEAESMMGKILNSLLGDGKEGVLRTQRIDGSKLPEFEMVRRYLGPAGLTATTEADGWFVTGFTLNKEAPEAAPQAETAAKP